MTEFYLYYRYPLAFGLAVGGQLGQLFSSVRFLALNNDALKQLGPFLLEARRFTNYFAYQAPPSCDHASCGLDRPNSRYTEYAPHIQIIRPHHPAMSTWTRSPVFIVCVLEFFDSHPFFNTTPFHLIRLYNRWPSVHVMTGSIWILVTYSDNSIDGNVNPFIICLQK